jgi:hypothetical protein
LLVNDLSLGSLVAGVMNHFEVVVVVLPIADRYELASDGAALGEAGEVSLRDPAVEQLAIGPDQRLGVEPERRIREGPALVTEVVR